jgi:tetratricopeptide (TPR) repeat protein
LAIELAAARVRTSTPEEINDRLDQRFRLLTGGSRTALPRQQTLRALVDWSYDLLTNKQKSALQAVSVFMGGWTLEAADAVCTDDQTETWEVFDLLTALADKSLVVVEQEGGNSRFKLLETVRQYAREHLLSSGKAEAVRARHMSFYCLLAESAGDKIRSSDRLEWVQKLDRDFDNVRAAQDWSSENLENAEFELRFCIALRTYWDTQGLNAEGLARSMAALKTPAGKKRGLLRAQCLRVAAACLRLAGDLSASEGLLKESLEIANEFGDLPLEAALLSSLGFTANLNGRGTEAQAYLEQAIQIYDRLGDRERTAIPLNNLGDARRLCGDALGARRAYERALSISKSANDDYGVAMNTLNLGDIAAMEGNLKEAFDCYESATQLGQACKSPLMESWGLTRAGHILIRLVKLDDAKQRLRAAAEILVKIHMPFSALDALREFGNLAITRGDTALGIRLLSACQSLQLGGDHHLGVPGAKDMLEVARNLVDPATFETHFSSGQAFSFDEAVELALG